SHRAGGVAGAGVGLGMGMAYARAAAPGSNGPVTGPSRAPLPLIPPSPQLDPVVWHVVTAGVATGPFSLAQVREAIGTGQVTSESQAWAPGMGQWAPVSSIPTLASLFIPPPPPQR